MTFYNIIAAVLFVGAFRELLVGLQAGDMPALWRAAVLALLVFNDAIFTSWTIETREKPYKPILMCIDLINFSILTANLIFLNASANNVLQLNLDALKNAWLSEPLYWALLALYWVMVEVWTKAAGIFDEPHYPQQLIPWSRGIIVVFLVQALATSVFGSASISAVTHFLSFVAFAYPTFYILVIRGWALRGGLDPAKPRAAA